MSEIKLKYNNGESTQTVVIHDVTADHPITAEISSANGFQITKVSGANFVTGYITGNSVPNFIATKVSNYKYNISFTLSDSNIQNLSTSRRKYIRIFVTTEKAKKLGNISIDTSKLVNCSISPTTVVQETETTITLNADTGFILNGEGTYTVDRVTNTFTCNKVASHQLTITANSNVSISFTATKVEAETNSNYSSIVHTYVLSPEKYNILGKQIIDGVNSNGTGFEQYDYTKFINYLFQIPFPVGSDLTTSTNTINLGKQNLNIDCQKVTHETLNIDLGSIDLTNVATSNDMRPISITLFAPFSSNIVLPTTVLGSKIYLSFSINLKTELAVLIIKQNDNIIYSEETELFTDLPLYFSAGAQDTLVKQLRAQYQNIIKQAYVIMNYNKPITGLTSYETTEHGKLSNYKGFTRVSHGTLKRSISSSIDNGLLSLLRQGVIIK